MSVIKGRNASEMYPSKKQPTSDVKSRLYKIIERPAPPKHGESSSTHEIIMQSINPKNSSKENPDSSKLNLEHMRTVLKQKFTSADINDEKKLELETLIQNMKPLEVAQIFDNEINSALNKAELVNADKILSSKELIEFNEKNEITRQKIAEQQIEIDDLLSKIPEDKRKGLPASATELLEQIQTSFEQSGFKFDLNNIIKNPKAMPSMFVAGSILTSLPAQAATVSNGLLIGGSALSFGTLASTATIFGYGAGVAAFGTPYAVLAGVGILHSAITLGTYSLQYGILAGPLLAGINLTLAPLVGLTDVIYCSYKAIILLLQGLVIGGIIIADGISNM